MKITAFSRLLLKYKTSYEYKSIEYFIDDFAKNQEIKGNVIMH